MRYIFFDVNGVLIKGLSDRIDGVDASWTATLERDLGIDPFELEAIFFNRAFKDVQMGKKDLVKAMTDILPEIRYNGMAQTVINYWFEKDSEINQATFEVIKKLKEVPGKRLFIASNQEKYRAYHLWDTLGFKKYFEEFYFSGRMGMLKKDPKFFNAIENELCLTERDCLLIDDNPEVIKAAKEAGWHTYLFTTAEALDAYLFPA
jgi:putative hydrolase of the HAD superfamily